MQTDLSTIQTMRELVGEEPMGAETGMNTLYQALALDAAQVVVLHGQVARIKQQLLHRFPGGTPPSPPQGTHKGCPYNGTDTSREPIRAIVGASLVGALGGEGDSPQRMDIRPEIMAVKANEYFKKQLPTHIKL